MNNLLSNEKEKLNNETIDSIELSKKDDENNNHSLINQISWHLVILEGPISHQVIELNDNLIISRITKLSMNSESKNIIYIDDSLVSRNHAEFLVENNECFIQDLQSTNGTHVNGSKINSGIKFKIKKENNIVAIGKSRILVCDCNDSISHSHTSPCNYDDMGILCVVCKKDLGLMDIMQRQIHINNCLDEGLSVQIASKLVGEENNRQLQPQDESEHVIESCVVCGMSLIKFTTQERLIHIENCISAPKVEIVEKVKADPKPRQTKRSAKVQSVLRYRTPESVRDAETRLRIVDDRIRVLQEYRASLVASMAQAEIISEISNASSCDSVIDTMVQVTSESDSKDVYDEIEVSKLKMRSQLTRRDSILSDHESVVHADYTHVDSDRDLTWLEIADNNRLQNLIDEYGLNRGTREDMVRQIQRVWRSGEKRTSDVDVLQQPRTLKEQEKISNAICNALTNCLQNEEIYGEILIKKCVDLKRVQRKLDDANTPVSPKRLKRFLDCHGVVYES